MEYRSLGKTGVKVSKIALGDRYPIASEDDQEGIKNAHQIMDEAFDMGINYFDTANYGAGRFEIALGQWLKKKGSQVRDQLIIGTKVYSATSDNVNDQGLSRRHILKEVENSLRRLQVDHIDMYWSHAPDSSTRLEETLSAFDKLIADGKIRYFGHSNIPGTMLTESLWKCDQANLVAPTAVQNAYNLIEWHDEKEVLPFCQEKGLGFIGYSPMSRGVLTGKYEAGKPRPKGSLMNRWLDEFDIPVPPFWRQEVFESIQILAKEAKERNASLPTLSMAWAISNEDVSAVLIGPKKPEDLADSKKAIELKLTAEDRKKFNSHFPAAYQFDWVGKDRGPS